MKLYMKAVAVGLLALLLVSCSSLKGFKNPVGEGNLYGLIIDEKNQPVKDFKIVCSDERESVKSAVTNDSGIFVIENMLTGNLTISGVGDGYVKIKNEKIEFLGNEKIFCWQISSLEGILLEVERQIKEKNYQKALNMLADVNVSSESDTGILLKKLEKQLKKNLKNKEA